MTREDAARVLREMRLDKLSSGSLCNVCCYIRVITREEEADLDGQFTADQLEAIAAWMRDPTIVEIKP